MAASSGQDRESDWSYPRPGAVLSREPAPGSGLSLSLSYFFLAPAGWACPAVPDWPTYHPLPCLSAPNAQNSNYGGSQGGREGGGGRARTDRHRDIPSRGSHPV